MNFERIRPTIDVDRMQASHVTNIRDGYGLMADLLRCGLRSATLIDFDHIDATNPARQYLNTVDLGRAKVEATAEHLRRINPDIEIEILLTHFCALDREQMDELLG